MSGSIRYSPERGAGSVADAHEDELHLRAEDDGSSVTYDGQPGSEAQGDSDELASGDETPEEGTVQDYQRVWEKAKRRFDRATEVRQPAVTTGLQA